MDGLPRTATATVVEDATLIMIQRSEFLRLLRNEPMLSLQLIELLCKRLRWTSELIEESAFLDGEARLAKRLLILSTLHGRLNKSNKIELSISQDDLAHFLGVSRQAVNQYLREWQRKSWVALGRNRISILDAEALKETVRTA
jgi:CRP-like cAMP-binding protein